MKRISALLLIVALLICAMPAMVHAEDNTLHIIGRNLGFALDGDNATLKKLEEATGLDIEWELWPTDNYAQQCQLLIASGEWPDAMEIWWSTYPNQFMELIEDDVVQPLDEYIATGGPHIQEMRDASMYYDYGDGKIYGVPCRVLEDNNTYCLWIRQDWLDALDLSMPTNSQEYYDVLKAFQANAEQLTGNPDTFMGHGACTTYFGNCLTEYVLSENGITKGWNEVDDGLVYYVNMPGYKNAIGTLRTFYQDGLIEREYLLMNRDQFLDKWYQNIYGAIDYTTDLFDPAVAAWTRSYYEAVPEAEMKMVPPFADENGKAHLRTVNQTIQCIAFTGSPNAANLIKLLDYLATEEGMLLVQFGIEGEHWDYDANGEPVSKLTTDEERAKAGIGSYAWMFRRSYFNNAFSSEFDGDRAVLKNATVPTPVLPATPTYLDVDSTLSTLLSTFVAEAIVTEDPGYDYDAAFDKFVSEWNSLGGEKWTQEINEYWKSR